jgi:hypothetical protein
MVSTLGHESYIIHSGYGYSKRLCESVASWYVNKYLRNRGLEIEIFHRGLKREGVNGWCDTVGTNKNPKEFLIELDTYMEKELYTRTLLHELVHVSQWVEKRLTFSKQHRYFMSINVDEMEYEDQPHEKEAYEKEKELLDEYQREMEELKKKVKEINRSVPRHLL